MADVLNAIRTNNKKLFEDTCKKVMMPDEMIERLWKLIPAIVATGMYGSGLQTFTSGPIW